MMGKTNLQTSGFIDSPLSFNFIFFVLLLLLLFLGFLFLFWLFETVFLCIAPIVPELTL